MTMIADDRTVHRRDPQEAGPPPSLSISGRFVKIAALRDEWYEDVSNPEHLINFVRGSRPSADILSFIQRLPDATPKYSYHMEWDNVAAVPVSDYETWWKEQIPKSTRTHVRKAAKSGVVARLTEFDEAFVKGIAEIYNEAPMRQGRPFKHYRKDFETLWNAHITFLDRSQFIGAFLGDELIGFIKLVHSAGSARTMQVISKFAHRDKCPVNLLIAKAVEMCAERKAPYLVYGKFEYGNRGSKGLMDFKKDNGFVKTLIPRYFAGLNGKGRLAIKLGLHKNPGDFVPRPVQTAIRGLRAWWYERRLMAAGWTSKP